MRNHATVNKNLYEDLYEVGYYKTCIELDMIYDLRLLLYIMQLYRLIRKKARFLKCIVHHHMTKKEWDKIHILKT